MKKPMFQPVVEHRRQPAAKAEPQISTTQERAILASIPGLEPKDTVDTIVLVIRRTRNVKNNGLTMDCAVTRNGELQHSLSEPVGPGYEVFEAGRALRLVEKLWRRMRSGRGVPWTL